ncbi:branched-chain amino acid transport system permease protein [Rhodoligotrophos appendicifer]|uniref:branched-chain amino acid ABC transporter permease n=1 Tax=Rhodoligotrophos appendicifer TaxID=987056 RepID=UPI0011872C3F|nr:branched-chain amino acid ABC transporter permease [Rhodoligotrophos appendicifer]
MEELTIILVRGLGLGAIYALIAISLNAIHRATGIFNFAQGMLFVVAGILAALTMPSTPNPYLWLALLPLAAVALAAAMAVQGYITLLPLRSSVEQHSWLVSTLAVSVLIGAIILLIQGNNQILTTSQFPSFPVFGTRTPAPYVLAIAAALLWWAALRWFHTKTLTGLSISAIAQDLDAASAAGLRVRRLQVLAFGISGLIVGSAGFIAAPIVALANDSGLAYVTNGFVAAVVGGIGSDTGALVGGALVGVISMYAAFEYGGEFQNVVTLGLLVLVLMVRPEGLFGTPAARKV